jgi:hypothetical protein
MNPTQIEFANQRLLDEYELFFETIRSINRWASTPSNRAIHEMRRNEMASKCTTGEPMNDVLLAFLHDVSGHWFSGDVFENVDCVLLTADALNNCIDKTRIKKVRASCVGFCESCGKYTLLQTGHNLPVTVVGNGLGAANERCICAKCNSEEGTHTGRNSIARYLAARTRSF